MAREMVTRGGGILLWRLGALKYGEQSHWERAPFKKGMWAFPYPYFDGFFTNHQYGWKLPKELQTIDGYYPRDIKWFQDSTGDPLESHPVDEDGKWIGPSTASVKEEYWAARDRWINEVGKKILPVRKFFYEGYLYSHIQRSGEIGNSGTWSGQTDWLEELALHGEPLSNHLAVLRN